MQTPTQRLAPGWGLDNLVHLMNLVIFVSVKGFATRIIWTLFCTMISWRFKKGTLMARTTLLQDNLFDYELILEGLGQFALGLLRF